jgi:hypothetical protein
MRIYEPLTSGAQAAMDQPTPATHAASYVANNGCRGATKQASESAGFTQSARAFDAAMHGGGDPQ